MWDIYVFMLFAITVNCYKRDITSVQSIRKKEGIAQCGSRTWNHLNLVNLTNLSHGYVSVMGYLPSSLLAVLQTSHWLQPIQPILQDTILKVSVKIKPCSQGQFKTCTYYGSPLLQCFFCQVVSSKTKPFLRGPQQKFTLKIMQIVLSFLSFSGCFFLMSDVFSVTFLLALCCVDSHADI